MTFLVVACFWAGIAFGAVAALSKTDAVRRLAAKWEEGIPPRRWE